MVPLLGIFHGRGAHRLIIYFRITRRIEYSKVEGVRSGQPAKQDVVFVRTVSEVEQPLISQCSRSDLVPTAYGKPLSREGS